MSSAKKRKGDLNMVEIAGRIQKQNCEKRFSFLKKALLLQLNVVTLALK